MSYLYVVDGATLGVDGGYYVVHYKNGDIKKIPSETLESVALFGNVSITTPCVKKFLENGIAVSYFSKKGSYFGRLESTRHTNVFRLKKQIHLSDNPYFKLPLAQKMISAKINNQAVILTRYQRSTDIDVSYERFMMHDLMEKAKNAQSIAELMGYEGNAAKHYFQGLSKVVNQEFAFNGRTRMPPKDAFNSMLSLGYTMLMYEIYGEIENKGLSPYAGFIHSDKERHPTLASDLMEEWRAVIVDSVVMSLVNGKEIDPRDFITDEESGGVFILSTGMPKFIKKFEEKLRSETGYINSSYKMSFRKALWHQVNRLVSAIEAEDPYLYEPIVIR
ncbi:MAG: CRISPR-associated endonuclease Cas1 [Oscillospiraceae bacterium]|nr:CRISPR-associated endonuclease Cas1 [Oscillospiraceae bacterium]